MRAVLGNLAVWGAIGVLVGVLATLAFPVPTPPVAGKRGPAAEVGNHAGETVSDADHLAGCKTCQLCREMDDAHAAALAKKAQTGSSGP
jgi:hypothetical protein